MNKTYKFRKRLPPIPPSRISDSNDRFKLFHKRISYKKNLFACPICGYIGEIWDATENKTECPGCREDTD